MNPTVAGIYAYSGQSSFVNTCPLTSAQLSDSMLVVASYNTGRSYTAFADFNVQPSSCSSSNMSVLVASPAGSGCLVSVDHSNGASLTNITATYGGWSTTVSYRVYFFLGHAVLPTRFVLRRLGCDYETSVLTAHSTITLDGLNSLGVIDVSDLVTFSSSTPGVVSINGRVARGVTLGSATLSFGVGTLASVSISVTNNSASVIEMVSYAYTGVSVTPTAATHLELDSTLIQVQPVLSLTAEGQTAIVATFARDDDGVWSDVSLLSTLFLTSNDPTDLNVSKVSGIWRLIVPVGAASIASATSVIRGTLTDSCAAALISTGYGYASTNLSTPISILVTSASPSLARPSTPASTTLGFPTSTHLTVTITFRSSMGVLTTRDFTTDARTMYTSSFINCVGTTSGSGLVSLTSSSGLGTSGSVNITVTFPSYSAASGLSGSITVPVVDVNAAIALSGTLVHAMTPSVPVTSGTPLAMIACTGEYQLGLLATVRVTLTDGTTRLGTPTLSSANVTVAAVSGTTVTPVSGGTATIVATYAAASGTFAAYVSASSVSVTSIALSYSSSTLSGLTGASSAGSVAVSFSDGTSFANAVASFSPLSSLSQSLSL